MILQEVRIECDGCRIEYHTMMRNGVIDVPEGWFFEDNMEQLKVLQTLNAPLITSVHVPKHFCSEACRAAVTTTAAPEPFISCGVCNDRGYVETGNNDLPCENCVRGRDTVFSGGKTGAQIIRSYNNYTHARWPKAWGPRPDEPLPVHNAWIGSLASRDD